MSIVFKSTKECIDMLNLQDYIKEVSKINSYGHCFEEVIVKNFKSLNVNIRRTSAEFDIVRGADLRLVFDNTSVLVDIKLLTARSLKGSKRFINAQLNETRNEKELHFFNLDKGIDVAFCLKDFSNLGKIGYCKFNKPVITAVFRIDREKEAHEYINRSVALSLKELIRIINERMIEEGADKKVSNSFEFRYHKQRFGKYEGGGKNDEYKRAYEYKGSVKSNKSWNR